MKNAIRQTVEISKKSFKRSSSSLAMSISIFTKMAEVMQKIAVKVVSEVIQSCTAFTQYPQDLFPKEALV